MFLVWCWCGLLTCYLLLLVCAIGPPWPWLVLADVATWLCRVEPMYVKYSKWFCCLVLKLFMFIIGIVSLMVSFKNI